MSSNPAPPRNRADACPGALTTHAADDGALARVRLPGGRVSAGQLGVLASCAEALGDGALHLTSRANVQFRGVSDVVGLAERLAAAGLLPSATHERVRNVVASPASGLVGGLVDVRPLVTSLDAAICASPSLAELPGRFWFGLDDGRGDVGGSFDDRVDVCWRAVSDDTGALLLAGADTGVRVPLADAVDVLIDVAAAFVRCRGEAWQVRELGDAGRAALLAACGERRFPCVGRSESVFHRTQRSEGVFHHGAVAQDDGRAALHVGLRFGTATAAQVRLLAEIAGEAIVTPWRSVLLPGLDRDDTDAAMRRLQSAGLLVEPHNPAASITACIGSQGCGKALADVRADATNAMSELATVTDEPGVAAHFAGCTRRCGRPPTPAVDVLADADGYLVDGEKVAAGELADVLAEKRATGTARAARRSAWEAQKGPQVTDYLTDGAEIYRRSFATIRAEADLDRLPNDVERVVVRMIHSCGMTDLARDVAFTPDVVNAGHDALRAGAPILTDAKMIASGVTRSRLPADNDVVCTLADPQVPDLAATLDTTRSAAALELWRERLPGSVVAIGNAPTALFRLLELLDEGVGAPAAIIGVPVGFIGAVESKEELVARAPAPYLVVHGRRGGSAMAVAALNAIAQEAEL